MSWMEKPQFMGESELTHESYSAHIPLCRELKQPK
jgi:hypothetical protein